MTQLRYSYEDCIARSKAARWCLADFADLELDFSKEFMPESLAWTRRIESLSPGEALKLNQIRGYTYAHVFSFIEEFIVALAEAVHTDKEARQAESETLAYDLFIEEERKHQRLFEAFEQKFRDGFGSECELIRGVEGVRDVLMWSSRLSGLMLTSMLEWLTQDHFLKFFEQQREADDLDPSFKQLFRLHWVEEAQHARLDTIEALATAEGLGPDERARALDELIEMMKLLRDLLAEQSAMDVESLERAIERPLGEAERAAVAAVQLDSYLYAFVELALHGEKFGRLVEEICPGGVERLAEWAQERVDV